MSPSPELTPALAAFVEKLLDCTDAHDGDLVLLEAALAESGASAAALWRRSGARWSPELERGAADLLPRPDLVVALLTGALAEDLLPAGQVLVRTPPGPREAALALGGLPLAARADEERLDVLDALLRLRGCIERPQDEERASPPPPRPRTPPHPGSD